jgi:futalosine hydrolase
MILVATAVGAELGSWQPREGTDLLVTGVGPVEASTAVATALAQHPYELVVNAGIAGTFDRAARIGDGVIVADDAMELSLESGASLALPLGIELVDRTVSDPVLVDRLRARDFPALHGITVARVTSSEATARRLRERGAQVESMEGFAVLRAAQRAGVPAIQVRGISNRCGDRASSGWDFSAGVAGLRKVLDALFELLPEGVEQRR